MHRWYWDESVSVRDEEEVEWIGEWVSMVN